VLQEYAPAVFLAIINDILTDYLNLFVFVNVELLTTNLREQLNEYFVLCPYKTFGRSLLTKWEEPKGLETKKVTYFLQLMSARKMEVRGNLMLLMI